MIEDVWHWFIIFLVILGACTAILTVVAFLYLFAFYGIAADKLTFTFAFVKKLTTDSFKSLSF